MPVRTDRRRRVAIKAPQLGTERFGIKPLPGTALVLQERGYAAPIWYTP
ncbi:MAG: hypothetical protein JHC40_13570 [Burkholderiales bacterium]|jgi:hypothetical protein|nr:hypothetical protein [Burkholderiales bacterium]